MIGMVLAAGWGSRLAPLTDALPKTLLEVDGDRTILDVAYGCGFTSKSTFNAAFRRQLGETPSAYRRRHLDAAPAGAGSPRTPRG